MPAALGVRRRKRRVAGHEIGGAAFTTQPQAGLPTCRQRCIYLPEHGRGVGAVAAGADEVAGENIRVGRVGVSATAAFPDALAQLRMPRAHQPREPAVIQQRRRFEAHFECAVLPVPIRLVRVVIGVGRPRAGVAPVTVVGMDAGRVDVCCCQRPLCLARAR